MDIVTIYIWRIDEDTVDEMPLAFYTDSLNMREETLKVVERNYPPDQYKYEIHEEPR